MMSTEENWNTLQKQLTTSRKNNSKKQKNISLTENKYSNDLMKTKANTNEQKLIRKSVLNNVNSKVNKPANGNINDGTGQITSRKNPKANFPDASTYTNFYAPTSQSHLIATTPSKLNDPFGINPLPSLRSPYQSARDPFLQHPNLESWGVTDQAYDTYRFNPSPYLPVYNSIRNKPQKPYIIAPKFRRPIFQPPSPIMTDNIDFNSKFNYIAPKPYVRQASFERNDEIGETPSNRYSFDKIPENPEPLKSDKYLENAHKVLKTVDDKKYDGKELFSTKFIEDLEYSFTPATSSVKPRTGRKPNIPKNSLADEYIKTIKKQVNIIIPPRDYEEEPLTNTYAIDLAETIYKQEIEKLTRELVEQAINEEYNQVYLYQRPIFNQIFEETTNSMLKKLVLETVEEQKIQIEKQQTNEIKKVAKEKLVNNLMLDHMLTKVAQHGRVLAENEDINQLMDGMILDVLLHTHSDVRKVKEKTLNNYPIKKFHLNSFMNVALDILVAELSSNLEEDMKELENFEQITSKI